jgi:putative tricarboxylic transport membrane protein
MEVFSDLIYGLSVALSPIHLLYLTIGVLVGMVVGVMPGLGASAGIAVLLPLTFSMDPTSAIVMLAAIYYGAMFGGTITSVLINTPGESSTVATTFDGYPLAQQGRAGPALVLCAVGSFVAGTIGLILLTVLAPPFARLAQSFGPSETFLIMVIGLLTLVVIAGGKWRYGVISALFGFTLATVGVDLGTGEQRYTFGSPELITGINFIPVAIGLFGIGELLYTLHQGAHREEGITQVRASGPELWPKREDWSESKGAMARGSFLGFVVGTIPGAGATVASLMSYSLEKTISKTPERFGKGALQGLVGPESANNSASTGSMVPLLTLGIPGSASTAVLLGAFLLWGLQPGPLLMSQNPEFAWGLIGSMYLGNVMLVLLNVFAIPVFANIARVPARIMVPIVILLCVVGTFSVNGSIVETWIMLGCGVIGFFMKLFGYSPAATVIALVLGPLAEETLRQSLIIAGPSIFYTRSVSLLLLIVIGFLIAIPLALSVYRRSTRDR